MLFIGTTYKRWVFSEYDKTHYFRGMKIQHHEDIFLIKTEKIGKKAGLLFLVDYVSVVENTAKY